jgi:SagB-type dehydrogenase family enzyme
MRQIFREQRMCAVRRYEEIERQDSHTISRLFHLNSSLGLYAIREYAEHIQQFSESPELVKKSVQERKEYPNAMKTHLPAPSRWGGKKLRRILEMRRTRRGTFSGQALSLPETGTFLHYSAGITGEVSHPKYKNIVQKLRSWPSGGAMYPLEIYWGVLAEGELEKGFYHYAPYLHALEHVTPLPDTERLQKLFFADGLWKGAAVLVVISAIWERTQVKYGERGYRIVLLDTGHLAQNMALTAEDMNFNAILLGGFDDMGAGKTLNLTSGEEDVIYAMLLGKRS